jgi:hypothetical protein
VGRGLSELQKRILGIVYQKRQQRDFEGEERTWKAFTSESSVLAALGYQEECDATNAAILSELYDWPDRRGHRPSEYPDEYSGTRSFHGGNFNRQLIGEEEYNRRTASYYRAVARLKDRGLLEERGFKGLWITGEGIKEAEKLSARRARASRRRVVGPAKE